MFATKLSDQEQGVGNGAKPPPADTRLAGIPMEEPIFVLRATDLLAPVLINTWCSIHALNPKMPPAALKAARELAELMSRWPDRRWPGE